MIPYFNGTLVIMDKSLEQIRSLNIVREALLQGFNVDVDKKLSDLQKDAENYIFNIGNIDYTEEVNLSEKEGLQYFEFTDKNGFMASFKGVFVKPSSKLEQMEGIEFYSLNLWLDSDGQLVQFYTQKY